MLSVARLGHFLDFSLRVLQRHGSAQGRIQLVTGTETDISSAFRVSEIFSSSLDAAFSHHSFSDSFDIVRKRKKRLRGSMLNKMR